MKIEELQTYEQVINYLDKRKRSYHLLFGNGFSMAYDPKIFSYNALSTFIENTDDEFLKKLFKVANTKNFELIMQQLDNFVEIAKVFEIDNSFISKILEANSTLKNSLIEAVKELHPEHVFIVAEERSKSCHSFLDNFLSKGGKIYSTNYDLLMYWVLMRNASKIAIDGFGRELLNPEETKAGQEPEWSDLIWGENKNRQNIFYLHGTLPIFDTGTEIVKEEYDSRHYLLQKISDRMESKSYPIFVTAGNAQEKLNQISHNKYLAFCYDDFSNIEGSLIVFGFNFGEYDTHIIDAINKAANQGMPAANILRSVYIGVYSDESLEYLESIKDKFRCKINYFNAKTVSIWD
ncbi:DUF4917 family protein [Chryseobacterium sp. C-71]|uniref:DUF4917 family protein n=1 Tax=Chryseobacterium sp. C-71 TaxID=2893882 RepID=UPI001E65C2B4|nr:DUF4917 family protein [Chryseobacterium sp. C-71]UFH31643.1 DUF4917 family protein [Chryseobacterium sp. C-71]